MTFSLFLLSFVLFTNLCCCAFIGQLKDENSQLVRGDENESLKVVNGKTAKIEDWPFMASLDISELVASGVVLNDRWILTLASKVDQSSPEEIYIRVGSTEREKGGQFLRTEKIITHEDYKGGWDYNIAVIKSKSPIKLGKNVKPATLGTTDLQDGSAVTVLGWGMYKKHSIQPSEKLRAGNLTVLGWDECKKSYPEILTKNMMCTAKNSETGPCFEDWGDPLVHDGAVYGLYIDGEETCVPGRYPVFYTSVPALYQWVQSHITEGDDETRTDVKY